MTSANIGSICNRVYNLVDNIPTAISGELPNITQDQITYINQYTGLVINGSDISERFQPALVALTAGATQRYVEGQGSDKTFNLGDFSVTRNTFNDNASNAFTADGMEKLRRLGRSFGVRKTFG